MKIAILDVNYGNSGTGKIVQMLRRHLEDAGHSILSCYGRDSGLNFPEATKVAPRWEVLKHAGLARLTGLNGDYSKLATASFLRNLEDFQPDVVHLHELHGYYINLFEVIDYLAVRDIPTVWTFHCEYMYTGKCGYAHECMQWQSRCEVCPQLREYPSSWFFDRVGEMFDQKVGALSRLKNLQIVTPSRWLAERVLMSFLKNRPVEVIHNGIDVENIFFPRDPLALRRRLGMGSSKVVFSAAMNLMLEIKGGHFIKEIATRFAGKDVKFLMVGVPEGLGDLGPNVVALPAETDQMKLAEYYSLADIFLLTSKKETFSLVCAESLACGTPVVGFDAGAPTEVAPEGYGEFVAYGNVDAIVAAIKRGISSESRFFTPQKCQAFARQNFSSEIMAKKYFSSYCSVFEKKSS